MKEKIYIEKSTGKEIKIQMPENKPGKLASIIIEKEAIKEATEKGAEQ